MKVFFALIYSEHGSLMFVETSETERWQNGKMERTAAKETVVRFWNVAKSTHFRRADCSGP